MEVTQFVDKGEDKSREKKDVLNQTNQSSNGNVTLNKSLFNDTTVALKIDNQETTQLRSQNSQKLGSIARKRYFGPNTVGLRDYIPIEESVLNYKEQIMEDVGKHKKIYLRKDKIDTVKPAEEIFEFRKKLRERIIREETLKESVNYMNGLKVHPYQKK